MADGSDRRRDDDRECADCPIGKSVLGGCPQNDECLREAEAFTEAMQREHGPCGFMRMRQKER